MGHELEVTVLDIDADAVIETLRTNGAKETQNVRLIVDWYRQAGVTEGSDPWYLRIRSYSNGRHEVTWKAKSDAAGIARRHKEINFEVSHPSAVGDLFVELGLERYAYQEKDRVSFALGSCAFDIDQYPGMAPYLEIEAPDERAIHEAIELLGVKANRTWNEGERKLIQNIYGLDWYDMRF